MVVEEIGEDVAVVIYLVVVVVKVVMVKVNSVVAV